MVAQLKRPYSQLLFRKLFLETHTTKNFRSTKPQILQELQTSFKKKPEEISPSTNYHQLKLKYSSP